MDPIEQLLQLLRSARSWPIKQEAQLRKRLALYIAFRESQVGVLRQAAGWASDRLYIIDNLPAKIAEAYGSLMWGTDPRLRAATEDDQDRLETGLWTGNSVPSGLQSAEETCVSEGEVWWRWSIHPSLPRPVLTWHSRWDVVPLLHGRDVIAVAFVSRYKAEGQQVYRHLEIHGHGVMENRLFLGRAGALGYEVPLDRHVRTADLPPRWDHALPAILAGRIVNRWGRDDLAGVSIYNGIWPQFLVLNEATTIGRENMKLTAKKRAIMPRSAARPTPIPRIAADGEPMPADADQPVRRGVAIADVDEDVILTDELDAEEGKAAGSTFKILEYSFDADALITYMENLTTTIALRCDLVPQFLGRGDFGSAASGTALRVRLLPTVNAVDGRARYWDDDLPDPVLRTGQLLDAATPPNGIGYPWTTPELAPSIDRLLTLPEDPADRADRISRLRTSSAMSIFQAVKEQHDDWTDEQINEEVDRIRADERATVAPVFGGGPPPNGGGEGGEGAAGGGTEGGGDSPPSGGGE